MTTRRRKARPRAFPAGNWSCPRAKILSNKESAAACARVSLKCAAPWKSSPRISVAKARKRAAPERSRMKTGPALPVEPGEKVSAKKPRLRDRRKAELLCLLAGAEQIELRWHLALMIPRLPLTAREGRRAAGALECYLEDPSSIVKTCALEGLE